MIKMSPGTLIAHTKQQWECYCDHFSIFKSMPFSCSRENSGKEVFLHLFISLFFILFFFKVCVVQKGIFIWTEDQFRKKKIQLHCIFKNIHTHVPYCASTCGLSVDVTQNSVTLSSAAILLCDGIQIWSQTFG